MNIGFRKDTAFSDQLSYCNLVQERSTCYG